MATKSGLKLNSTYQHQDSVEPTFRAFFRKIINQQQPYQKQRSLFPTGLDRLQSHIKALRTKNPRVAKLIKKKVLSGSELKNFRLTLGWNKMAFCTAIGVHWQTYTKNEGKTVISPHLSKLIAKHLSEKKISRAPSIEIFRISSKLSRRLVLTIQKSLTEFDAVEVELSTANPNDLVALLIREAANLPENMPEEDFRPEFAHRLEVEAKKLSRSQLFIYAKRKSPTHISSIIQSEFRFDP